MVQVMICPVVFKRSYLRFAAWIVAVTSAVVVVSGTVRADSVNSPNITMNVDTNRAIGSGNGAGNVSVVVNTITIAEISLPEYSSGAGKQISIRAKPGFQFDPTSNVTAQSATIGINGGGLNAVATVVPSGLADEVITFSLTSGTNTNVQDIIRINGIRVRIIAAAGAVGPAQTTLQLTTSTAGGAFTDQGIVATNITKGLPDHLAFSIQPGDAQAGADILPAVRIVDFGENIITNDVRNITLAIQSNPGAAALNGTLSKQTANGIATWADADNLNILTAANGYTLRASHNGDSFLTSDTVDSTAFNITAGAPNHLTISQQPVNTAAGAPILLAVSVFDSLNNLVNVAVPVTLDSAINPGGWPLLTDSSLTKTTVGGVATWGVADNLRINKAITGYRLSASGVGAAVETNTFDITPSAPALLKFVQEPTNTSPNVAMNPAVAVEITDAFSNRTDSGAVVNLSLLTAPCGGNLAGASANAIAGIATFQNLSANTACNGNVLSASSGNLPSTTSGPFNIGSGAACGTCGQGLPLAAVPFMVTYVGMKRRNRSARRR